LQVAQKEDVVPKVVEPKQEVPDEDFGSDDAFDLIADSDTDHDTFFGSR